ncbi:DUF4267 domain-containing protein [Kitasatospora atroaurantiaca]|uniref:Uncharacterized protein DUF4267 n=1 Tax=Kitasatospora atroaurantiaca TaxID=285545 RepID=A0A561EYB8_9ACTN|nr:DUF4267 domain-containing protein [Kitasatospora atroaurantiaca]TWE20606.1 uncharacterized protein DUF4267 [Kitasatospora atroaurantiaca]
MSRNRLLDGLAALGGIGIILIGTRFLLDPDGAASGFGIPSWPHGEAAGYLDVKGLRDIVSGLVILALLATGQRRALGWALIIEAVTPTGDMLIVLSHGGTAAAAFGIHGATAAAVATLGVLTLRGTREAHTHAVAAANP